MRSNLQLFFTLINQRRKIPGAAVPPTGNTVLFVKGALALNTSESMMIGRLEGQGHIVDVTTDSDLTTIMANGYDLVVMSKTVTSTTVGTKLRTSTTPILFWEDNQQQGIEAVMLATIYDNQVTGTAWHGTNTTIFVNGAAPAAQRANLSGSIALYTQTGEITFAPLNDAGTQETLIPGATRIAEYVNSGNGRWVIYSVEAGTTLSDATTAPARRVFFGLYDDTFQYLTSNGLNLFDAQIDWLLETAAPTYDLIGVGSVSTSLVDYPKIADTTTGTIYLDGSAPTNGNGAFATPFNSLTSALAALTSGATLLIRGGTYNITGSGIGRSTSWGSLTRVMRYGTEEVIFDGVGVNFDAFVINFSGAVNELWHGIEVINGPDGVNNGQAIRFADGANTCTISEFDVHHCGATGIFGYGAYNITILDTWSWAHGSGSGSGDTNSADAFAFTGNANSGLTGIKYVRCAGAYCQDDIFDMYRNAGALCVDCVAYKPGFNWSDGTFASGGDGNAYKMGSNEANTQDNVVRGSLAIGAANNGFDDNDTNEGNDFLFNTAINCGNTAKNGFGFQLGGDAVNSIIKNNIGWTDNRVAAIEWGAGYGTFNSWNQGQGNPLYGNPATYDWSLDTGSPYITAGEGGVTMGASDVALALAKEFIAYVEANRV